jgi:hypothetical protein
MSAPEKLATDACERKTDHKSVGSRLFCEEGADEIRNPEVEAPVSPLEVSHSDLPLPPKDLL